MLCLCSVQIYFQIAATLIAKAAKVSIVNTDLDDAQDDNNDDNEEEYQDDDISMDPNHRSQEEQINNLIAEIVSCQRAHQPQH